jgi:hypothetical protein
LKKSIGRSLTATTFSSAQRGPSPEEAQVRVVSGWEKELARFVPKSVHITSAKK